MHCELILQEHVQGFDELMQAHMSKKALVWKWAFNVKMHYLEHKWKSNTDGLERYDRDSRFFVIAHSLF